MEDDGLDFRPNNLDKELIKELTFKVNRGDYRARTFRPTNQKFIGNSQCSHKVSSLREQKAETRVSYSLVAYERHQCKCLWDTVNMIFMKGQNIITSMMRVNGSDNYPRLIFWPIIILRWMVFCNRITMYFCKNCDHLFFRPAQDSLLQYRGGIKCQTQ